MANLIAFAVIAAIVGCAAGYVYKEKKRGAVCIGCPESGSCGGHCAGCSSSCGGRK